MMKPLAVVFLWFVLVSLVALPAMYVISRVDLCDVFVANPACR